MILQQRPHRHNRQLTVVLFSAGLPTTMPQSQEDFSVELPRRPPLLRRRPRRLRVEECLEVQVPLRLHRLRLLLLAMLLPLPCLVDRSRRKASLRSAASSVLQRQRRAPLLPLVPPALQPPLRQLRLLPLLRLAVSLVVVRLLPLPLLLLAAVCSVQHLRPPQAQLELSPLVRPLVLQPERVA